MQNPEAKKKILAIMSQGKILHRAHCDTSPSRGGYETKVTLVIPVLFNYHYVIFYIRMAFSV